jgi:chromosomal replication initiation ATPase DnaA
VPGKTLHTFRDENRGLRLPPFDTKIEFLTKSAKGRGASNTPRKVAMYVAQQLRDHRLSDIAEYFGLQHYGGVSSAISE